MKIKKKLALIELLIFLVLFRGLIDNFFGHGTLYVDITVFVIFLVSLTKFHNINKSRFSKPILLYAIILLLASFLLIIHVGLGMTSVYRGVLGLRNDFIYILPFVFCLLFLNSDDVVSLDNYILNLGFFVCLFGIAQYFGRNVLPQSLLSLKAEESFTLYGYDLIRVNGLLGNTVVFSGFCVFYIGIVWAKILLEKPNLKRNYMQLIVAIIANLLTFSRASIVSMIAVIALEYLFSVPRDKVLKSIARILVILILSFAGYYIAISYFSDSVIVQRLTSNSSLMNDNSDRIHFLMIKKAIQYISSSPILGYGIGTAGYSAVKGSNLVTDGSFWSYLVQYGIPVCLIFALLIAYILKISIKSIREKNTKHKYIALGFFSSNIALLAMSLINSAYSARSELILIWIYSAFTLIIYRDNGITKIII